MARRRCCRTEKWTCVDRNSAGVGELVVGGGWRLAAVGGGGWWRLVAVGGWRLVKPGGCH